MIKKIIIPKSVIEIHGDVFNGCLNLKEIVIPNVIEIIERHVLFGEKYLCGINLPYSIKYLNNNYFYENYIYTLIIPNYIEKIGAFAFFDCINLIKIIIPNSVIEIGKSAFENCSDLEEIIIPNSVNYIGDFAFAGCSSLKDIIIPNSELKYGLRIFSGCSANFVFPSIRRNDNTEFIPDIFKKRKK